MTKNYVDNKLLHQEMVKYITVYKQSVIDGTPKPKVSNYVGECIWLIANRLSTNRNFIGYSYRDEMIGDAIENCLRYIHNFDPEKSSNPFAYFTQIMYYAFLRRIEKEKKQTYIKFKTMENSIAMNAMIDSPMGDDGHNNSKSKSTSDNGYASNPAYYEKMTILSEKYEAKAIAKKKALKVGVAKFIGESNE